MTSDLRQVLSKVFPRLARFILPIPALLFGDLDHIEAIACAQCFDAAPRVLAYAAGENSLNYFLFCAATCSRTISCRSANCLSVFKQKLGCRNQPADTALRSWIVPIASPADAIESRCGRH